MIAPNGRSQAMNISRLEELASQIDDLEACTSFITSLSLDDFDSGYRFLLNRVRELKHYLVNESDDTDRDELLDSIEELKDSITVLNDDAMLYEVMWDDDDDDDEDDFDFDDDDDDDDDDDEDEDDFDFDDDDDEDDDDDCDW